MSIRNCNTCTYKGIGGDKNKRCTRSTCKTGPMCWQHTAMVEGVRVAPSNIPGVGLGLFAARKFNTGDFISRYDGEHLTNEEYNIRYPNDDPLYVLPAKDGYKVDARYTNSGNARYANDSRSNNTRNAKLRKSDYTRRRLQATKPIRPGSEIFANYGPKYWKNSNNAQRLTALGADARRESLKWGNGKRQESWPEHGNTDRRGRGGKGGNFPRPAGSSSSASGSSGSGSSKRASGSSKRASGSSKRASGSSKRASGSSGSGARESRQPSREPLGMVFQTGQEWWVRDRNFSGRSGGVKRARDGSPNDNDPILPRSFNGGKGKGKKKRR
jgi:hypothetical protein